MSNTLRIDVDISGIASQFEDSKDKLERELKQSVKALSASTKAKADELAKEKLNGGELYKIYRDALSWEEIGEDIYSVSLDMDKAGFIESGRKAGFMEELLNGKSAKTNKKGERYAVIPFKQDKRPSEVSESSKDLLSVLKTELRKRKIPLRKLELDNKGSPRIGKLHTLDISSRKPSSMATHDALHGVNIYQRRTPHGKVKREIYTFRIIHEKHREQGKWVHPGMQASNILDETYDWAIKTFEREILPDILKDYGDR